MLMAILYAVSKKKPKEDGHGNMILQLPKFYPIFGILVIIGGLGLLIFAFFFGKENDAILASICSLLAFLTDLYLFAKGYISYIKVTDSGIIETSMFGKQNEIKWDEINDLSFGKVSLELKIAASDKNIKAHMHLIGFDNLITRLEEKTGKSKSEMGIPELN